MGWGPFGAPGSGYDMVSPPGPNLLVVPQGFSNSTRFVHQVSMLLRFQDLNPTSDAYICNNAFVVAVLVDV